MSRHPHVIVLSGPNGAGKSTAAPALLKGALGGTEFVNPDVIAQGLSALAPWRGGPEGSCPADYASWRDSGSTLPSRRRLPAAGSPRGWAACVAVGISST